MRITRNQNDHALELHKKSIVIDFHCDAVLATLPDSAYITGSGERRKLQAHARSLSRRSSEGHIDIPRLIDGGVDAIVFSHWVEPIFNPIAATRMLQILGYSLKEIEINPELRLTIRPEDIYGNHKKGISIIVGFEGGEALGEDLRLLQIFYRLGLRRLTLCWHNRNAIGDGAKWQRSGSRLTEFGSSVVEECNHLGIIVDVSHITDPGFWDVLEVSKDPVVASHSNCRALCSSQRCLSDDMIKALDEKGGVMGISFSGNHLIDQKKIDSGEVPTVSTVVDHIDHIVDVTGNTDCIGIGSDFEGTTIVPIGLEDVGKLPSLTKELVSRGYQDEEIEKILGGNFLRIIKKVWK
jgi:membrane dipeptidase